MPPPRVAPEPWPSTVSSPPPASMVSLPSFPSSQLSPESPVRVSAKREARISSKPVMVSPAAWPPELAPVARFTDTPRVRQRVVQPVRPVAADQGVRPPVAPDVVVAVAAVDRVAAAEAEDSVVALASDHVVGDVVGVVHPELVVVLRAPEVLDSGEGVARGMAAPDERPHPHVHRCVRPLVGRPVGACAPVQVVRPRAAFERVVAVATRQGVVAGASGQGVVVAGTHDLLEPGDGVARGMAAGDRVGGEVHRHPRVRPRVVQPVRPGAAIEGVRARLAAQGVGARAALEGVGAARADQGVVVGRAQDRLEVALEARSGIGIGQGVARGMAPETALVPRFTDTPAFDPA